MAIIYTDGYLKNLVRPEHEARALADVELIATFPDVWKDRLVEIRAYILAGVDCMVNPDDTFSAKITQYRREWNDTLTAAKAALADAGTLPHPGWFSVNMERG